jgi:hypothetical protein
MERDVLLYNVLYKSTSKIRSTTMHCLDTICNLMVVSMARGSVGGRITLQTTHVQGREGLF